LVAPAHVLRVSLVEAIERARAEAVSVEAAGNLGRHENFRAMQNALMDDSALATLGSCIAKETGRRSTDRSTTIPFDRLQGAAWLMRMGIDL